MFKIYPTKFFIIGLPRSGTTQLAKICGDHPDVSGVCIEPVLSCKKIQKQLLDGNTRECILNLYKIHDGIKEVYANKTICKKFRNHIYSLPIKIVAIVRSNFLQQSISRLIGVRTKIWHKDESVDQDDYLNEIINFGPIPLELVQRQIKNRKQSQALMISELKYRSHFLINYESFYLGSKDFQIETLKNMFNFIGIGIHINDSMMCRLNEGKLNNDLSYSCIQNINEIRSLESDENGWL